MTAEPGIKQWHKQTTRKCLRSVVSCNSSGVKVRLLFKWETTPRPQDLHVKPAVEQHPQGEWLRRSLSHWGRRSRCAIRYVNFKKIQILLIFDSTYKKINLPCLHTLSDLIVFPYLIKTLIETRLHYKSVPLASRVLTDTSEQKLLIQTVDAASN